MSQSFKETAHLKTDTEKFNKNYDEIDWSGVTKNLIITEEKDKSIAEYDELLNNKENKKL